eukprot:9956906-Lingulodinium_polyedra.AAC.1
MTMRARLPWDRALKCDRCLSTWPMTSSRWPCRKSHLMALRACIPSRQCHRTLSSTANSC